MKAPTPPDPYATAKAQGDQNIKTATAQQNINMVDQNNPYGSLKYTQTGTNQDGTPKYLANTSLSDVGQRLFDTENNTKLGVGDVASKLLHSNQGALSGNPLDLSYGATEAKLNELNRHTLDPQWQERTNQQEQQLYDRGVRPGSEAYDNSMRNFNSAKNNAYDQMYLGGHNTAVNDITQQYNSPLSTLSTLMSGSQPGQPAFQSTPQAGMQGVDLAGLITHNYDNQNSNYQGAMGGLFGLGSAALGAAGSAARGGMGR